MITKRPHILRYLTPGTNAVKDNNGDWTPGSPGIEMQVPCRYEPNGRGSTIASNDGSQIVYAGIIYMDVDAERVEYGTSVEVFNNEVSIFSGKAINFSNGQLNSRLWV